MIITKSVLGAMRIAIGDMLSVADKLRNAKEFKEDSTIGHILRESHEERLQHVDMLGGFVSRAQKELDEK